MRSLSRNRLGAEGAAALAPALAANSALTRVDIRHNNIAGDGAAQLAAAVLGNLKIEMFNEIPIKEMRANSLTELDLTGKGVGVEGGMVVAGLIPVSGGLTSINLSGNKLCGVYTYFGELRSTYTSVGIAAIAEALRINGGLTALDLSNNYFINYLKDEDVSAICEAIQSNKETKLASLNFEGNRISPVGANAVAAMVAFTGSLAVTNLLGNKLDSKSALMLAEVGKQKGISLCGMQRDQTTADLHYKHLMPPDAILLASDLSQAVVTGELTALDLSSNDLKDEDVSAICEAIRSNKETKLASLNFKCNGIGPVGAIAVAAMVAVTSSLTSLNLSENALCGKTYVGGTYTAEGITAIADALRGNGGLTSIDLSRNQLCGISDDWTCQQGTYTTEGITAIADALRVNGVLTKLSLAWNKLEEQGTKAICEALEQNRTLRELDLSGRNNIGGEAGAKHVADMLGVHVPELMVSVLAN